MGQYLRQVANPRQTALFVSVCGDIDYEKTVMSTQVCQRFLATVLLVGASLNAAGVCIKQSIYVGDTSNSQCYSSSIQAAIDHVTCPGSSVYITTQNYPTNSYTSQALTISGKQLNLVGTADLDCGGNPINHSPTPGNAPQATPPTITLSGDSSGDSVIHIDGDSHLTLQNLIITGGHVSNSGGGIYFGGYGALTLESTTVSNNQAGYGGGIDVSPSGGPAMLTLNANSLILNNTADTSGGGIRIEGDTRLFALQPQTLIAYNQATNGYGGGIEILGPARADIGSPGYNTLGAISWNSASNGGGIAAATDGAVARIFAHDSEHPTAVEHNSASVDGGGIYLQDATDVCLFAPDFDDNIAEDGAAIYKTDSGGIYVNDGIPARLGTDCGPESISDLGGALPGADCAFGAPCNVFDLNLTENPDGSPSDGAIIYHYRGELVGARFRVQSNSAGYAIGALEAGTEISRCLVTDNLIYKALIVSDYWGSGDTYFDQCTFSRNVFALGITYVMEFLQMNQVSLSGDIIDQQGYASVNFTPDLMGGTFGVTYTMSNDISTLPHGISNPGVVQVVDPGFVEPAIGDYHLRNDSPALDFEPAVYDFSLDCLYGPSDLPNVPNRFGPSDLGAYELYSTDRIFGSGFGDIVKPLDCP